MIFRHYFVTRDIDVLSPEIICITLSTLLRENVLPVIKLNSKLYELTLFIRYFELYFIVVFFND